MHLVDCLRTALLSVSSPWSTAVGPQLLRVFIMNKNDRNQKSTAYPHIVKREGVCGGEAIIEGTRIAVWHLVEYFNKLGMSVEQIWADWDYLTPAHVFSALAYYHDNEEEIDRVRRENSYERWQEHLAVELC